MSLIQWHVMKDGVPGVTSNGSRIPTLRSPITVEKWFTLRFLMCGLITENEWFFHLRNKPGPWHKLTKDLVTFDVIYQNVIHSKYERVSDLIEDLWSLKFVDSPAYPISDKSLNSFVIEFNRSLRKFGNSFLTRLGVCCFESRRISPSIECFWCEDVIPDEKTFYLSENKNIRTVLCQRCHKDLPVSEKGRGISEKIDRLIGLRKIDFTRLKNEVNTPEQTIACARCTERFHIICVKYVPTSASSKYVCNDCKKHDATYPDLPEYILDETSNFKYGHPDSLPVTQMSKIMEYRVNSLLCDDDGRIYIRVMANMSDCYVLDPTVADFLGQFGIADKFPFNSRVIFAFQQTSKDSVVAFFALYTQEYGEDAPAPNTNLVHISMIDSVQLLQTSVKRTLIYYTILLTYVDLMRQKGFKKVHVWTCPPVRRTLEYVFNRRPLEQTALTKKSLSEWYARMLDYGEELNIVKKYDWLSESFSRPTSPKRFFQKYPVLKDDHWVLLLKNVVEEKLSVANRNCELTSKMHKMSCLQPHSVYKILSRHLRKEKKSFFRIKLKSYEDRCCWRDMMICSSFMENRFTLTNYLHQNNLEFRDLRKASYSTKSFLTEAQLETLELNCDACGIPINFCLSCEEGEYCDSCANTLEHNKCIFIRSLSPHEIYVRRFFANMEGELFQRSDLALSQRYDDDGHNSLYDRKWKQDLIKLQKLLRGRPDDHKILNTIFKTIKAVDFALN